MDEPRIPIPAWVPWGTTACLAAVAACVGELWQIEGVRLRLAKDEASLVQAELKAVQNQLEAERILDARRVTLLRVDGVEAAGAPQVLAFGRPSGDEAGPWGVVVAEPGGLRALAHFIRLPRLGAGRDYQLWLEGSGAGPAASCLVFHPDDAECSVAFGLDRALGAGTVLTLFEEKAGGEATLAEARAHGGIVLATLPYRGRLGGP